MPSHYVQGILCLLTLLSLQSETVYGHSRSFYIDNLSEKAVEGYNWNLVETQKAVYRWLKLNIKHCTSYDPEAAFDRYSPCGQVVFNMRNQNRTHTWNIHTYRGTGINLTFNHMNLLDSLHKCGLQRLVVKCGDIITQYCGKEAPFNYLCIGNTAILELTFSLLGPTTRASTFQMVYQIYNSSYFDSMTYYKYELTPDQTILTGINKPWNARSGAVLLKKGFVDLLSRINQQTPKTIIMVTLVTMVTYQWVVIVETTNCTEIEAKDGPMIAPILPRTVWNRIGLTTYKSSGPVIFLAIVVDRDVVLKGCSGYGHFAQFYYHRLEARIGPSKIRNVG